MLARSLPSARSTRHVAFVIVVTVAVACTAACSSSSGGTTEVSRASESASTGGEQSVASSSQSDAGTADATANALAFLPEAHTSMPVSVTTESASGSSDASASDAAITEPGAALDLTSDAGVARERPRPTGPRASTSTTTTTASTTATATASTATPAANAAANGRSLFNRVCGRCHPGGNADIGPRLTGIRWDESRMRRQIRAGGGTMRPIAPTRLPETEMPALLAYLRSIAALR